MISVVIPAHNAGQMIGACLSALRNQTMPRGEYEIIVVDDGSRDDTAAAARAGEAQVLSQPQRGPASARNLGIRAARGEVVLFTDADCRPAPDWIEQLVAPLHDETVVGVKGAYATDQREPVARLAQLEFEERYDRLQKFRYVDFFDTHACALRKSALQAMGEFDGFFPVANNEDVDLAYRFAERGSRLVFNRRAVVYHRHPTGWRQYARQKFWRGYWRMQVYARYPSRMIADTYTPYSLKLQAGLMLLLLAALPAAVVWSPAGWLSAALIVLLFASGMPLYRIAWRRERSLLPLVPLFLVVRALAVGAGVVLGVLTVLRVLPLMKPRGIGAPVNGEQSTVNSEQ